jgi:hypothetical protein
MLNYTELFENTFLYKTFEPNADIDNPYAEKEVRIVDILDGPGADRRDYCTVEGIQDWEVDMPLENFLKNARIKEAA